MIVEKTKIILVGAVVVIVVGDSVVGFVTTTVVSLANIIISD